MTDYIAEYQRYENDAASAEVRAEQYRQRADCDRWEQCRIAHQATTDGSYSQRAFAEAVGVSQSTIGLQARVWKKFERALTRPSYYEAIKQVAPSVDRSNADKVRSGARNLTAEDKANLAAELLDDEEVAAHPTVGEKATSVARSHSDRRLRDEEDDMRARGTDPDSRPEPLPHDLIAEARRIADRADVSRDVIALLARAETDQRLILVQIIEPRVQRVLDALDAGISKVPDFVPEDL